MEELLYYLIIIGISFVQSIFGIGVLILGTPLFMIFGQSFLETLSQLLPLSALINIFQILPNQKHIKWKLIKLLVTFSLPFTAICLLLSLIFIVDLTLVIGIFMVFLAMKNFSKKIKNLLNKLMSYDYFVFSLLGIVHGFTNLGGSILSMKIFILDENKDVKRATMATAYTALAIVQIIIIYLSQQNYSFNIYFVLVGISTYILTDKFIFKELSFEFFDKLFSALILIFGLILVTKGL
tara:strand:+ start:721 stop:1434 length:714 start_codon:yes stop_codon:yes gene_type:complete